MPEARNDQEPSIEEILASIREIISDDDAAPSVPAPAKPVPAAAAAAAPVRAPEPALPEPVFELPASMPADDDNSDILDLGSFAQAQEPNLAPEAPVNRVDPFAGINLDKPAGQNLEFTDPLPEPVFEAPVPQNSPETIEDEPMVMPVPSNIGALGAMDEDALLNTSARQATVDSLSRLAQNIAIARAGNAGNTLEDVVKELLKPMLRDWLERNLPPMIERLVQRELERVTKQAFDR